MPHCTLRYCRSCSRVSKNFVKGITFHRFPRPGHGKREEWIKFVQKDRSEYNWLPKEHTCICSKHFREDDWYITKTGRRYLKKSAVPFPDPQNPETNNPSPKPMLHVYVSDSQYPIYTEKHQLKTDIKKTTNRKKKCLKYKKQKLIDIVKQLKTQFHVKSLIENETKLVQDATDVEMYINTMRKSGHSNELITCSPFVRKFALTLNYYSESAYRYVRNNCNHALPCPEILSMSTGYETSNAEPGFSEEVLKILKCKSNSASEDMPVVCSLIFDELILQPQKLFENNELGLVNFGIGPQEEKATQVLVFMLVSMIENWKVPIGYFLAASIDTDTKVTLINACLEKCHKAGASIVSLIFNASKTNLKVSEALGCRFSDVDNMKTYFSHPSTFENVYIFVDPDHTVKLIRNSFENSKVYFDEANEIVKWQSLVNLNKLQMNDKLDFKNKHLPWHVHFRNQVLKMKLATQLLSPSVAEALIHCDKVLNSSKFSDSAGTVRFITQINTLFDLFKTRKSRSNEDQGCIHRENKYYIFESIDKVRSYILSLQAQVKQTRIIKRSNRNPRTVTFIAKKRVIESQRQTGYIGAIINIESLKNMYLDVVENKRVLSYLPAHKLNQHHLELMFECIRKYGENNPNVIQFREAYKNILYHVLSSSSMIRSSIQLDNFSILTTSSINIINGTSGINRYSDKDFKILSRDNQVLKSDIEADGNCDILVGKLDSPNSTISANLIIGYISGLIARKFIKSLKCEECVTNLTTSKKLWYHKLITLKDMGGPCYSSEDVFQVCLKTETLIRLTIKTKYETGLLAKYNADYIVVQTLELFIGSDIFCSVAFHSFQQPSTLNHRLHIIRAIIEKYTNIRLNQDPEITFVKKYQKLKKLFLF